MIGRTFVALAVTAAFSVSCGASVSQRYESDVRFERCWSLDWEANVRPEIRRQCWSEWLDHFAQGQTRDRIEHARLQVADIEGRAEGARAATAAAVPEPTNAFRPVPMMTSAEAPPEPSASAAPEPPPPPPRNACQLRCDANLGSCLKFCKVAVCEAACTHKHVTCDTQCPKPAPPR